METTSLVRRSPWYPVRPTNNAEVTQHYENFSQAVEHYFGPEPSYERERPSQKQSSSQDSTNQRCRGRRGTVRSLVEQPIVEASPPQHHASEGWLSYWQALRARLRDLAKLLRKGQSRPQALPEHRAVHYRRFIEQIPDRLSQLAQHTTVTQDFLEQLRKTTEPLLWKRSDAVPAVEVPGLVVRVQPSGAEAAEESKNFNNELPKTSPS